MAQFKYILLPLALFTTLVCRTSPTQTASSKLKAEGEDYLTTLQTLVDYHAMGGQIDGTGPEIVKYSIDLDDANGAYFQNVDKYNFHQSFINEHHPIHAGLNNYLDIVFGEGEAKKLTAGFLMHSANYQINTKLRCGQEIVEQTGTPGTIAFNLYLVESGMADESTYIDHFPEIQNAYNILQTKIPFAAGNIGFVLPKKYRIGGCDLRKKFMDSGVKVIFQDSAYEESFLTDGDVAVYSAYKSYGYLKHIQTESDLDDYTFKDILIFADTPIDLSPLSGVISTKPQIPFSHVMLRAINQKIPDVYDKNALSKPEITQNIGKLVEFIADEAGGYSIKGSESIDAQELKQLAEAYFEARQQNINIDKPNLTESKILAWRSDPETITESHIDRYGAKGRNFAILDKELENVPGRDVYVGSFLIPFFYYDQHLTSNIINLEYCEDALKGCDDQAACSAIHSECSAFSGNLKEFIAESVVAKAETLLADSGQRRARLNYVRELIREGGLDNDFEDEVKDKIKAHYPETRRFRFRSSTNAEDIPELNGAGLYNSYSGCLADSGSDSESSLCMTELERTRILERIQIIKDSFGPDHPLIAELEDDLTDKDKYKKGLKKVFASLWNDRAFLSREYYGIKHENIYMAILAHPSYIDEKANGVIIIMPQSDGTLEIHVTSQIDDISITNPIFPDAIPENATLKYAPDQQQILTTTINTRSNQTEGDVLSDSQYLELAKQVTRVRNILIEKQILKTEHFVDLEFKIDSQDNFHVKQARPLVVE